MLTHTQTFGIITVVLVAGCTTAGILTLISALTGKYGEEIGVVNLVVLCAVFVLISCALTLYLRGAAARSKDMSFSELNFFSDRIRRDSPEPIEIENVCPICLCSFAVDGVDTHRRILNCCSTSIHEECLLTYCCHSRSNVTCPLCRAALSSLKAANPLWRV